MITLTTLTIIGIIGAILAGGALLVLCGILLTAGASFIFIFGDVIIFILIVWGIIKLIRHDKKETNK